MADNACCGRKTTVRPVKKTSCCGEKNQSCCGTAEPAPAAECAAEAPCGDTGRIEAEYVVGYLQTPAGEVPQVSAKLSFKDTLGSWKCRWSIGRMDYNVEPGLYAVGTPDENSPVLVTANYKMTFDRLREQLDGQSLWIMVLDTDGVNVWCAAGKGTFGTDELVHRIRAVKLDRVVKHRNVILPQLGAVGVAAHEVTKQTGFRVIYGTIRAKDIKAFLQNGMKATEEMRTVKFTAADRAVLTPVELVGMKIPVILIFGIFFILNAIGFGHYGIADLYGLLGAVAVGTVVTPILLPWIPGRAFAFKGALLGLLWAVGFLFLNGLPADPVFGWLKAAAYLLILPSLSAFCAMNFTGCSTFTSLSGVDKEMKYALPIMLFAALGGAILLLVGDFIRLFGGNII